jgi:hypothetical protein
MTDLRRYWLARSLFQAWMAVTHPDLLAAMWNSLSREDRQFWLERADRQLTEMTLSA